MQIIFGVVDRAGAHVDVSKTERGAKQYATRNGYDRVTARRGYDVQIIAHRHGEKWRNGDTPAPSVTSFPPMDIKAVGDYYTRDGHKVSITGLNGYGSHPVHGYVWEMVKGKLIKNRFCTWTRGGYHMRVGSSDLDIMRRVEDASH